MRGLRRLDCINYHRKLRCLTISCSNDTRIQKGESSSCGVHMILVQLMLSVFSMQCLVDAIDRESNGENLYPGIFRTVLGGPHTRQTLAQKPSTNLECDPSYPILVRTERLGQSVYKHRQAFNLLFPGCGSECYLFHEASWIRSYSILGS